MTRVLGIDPGLTRCGIGVVELLPGRRLEFVHVEVLTSSPQQPLEQRLLRIGSAVERLLQGSNPPTAIALERVFAQENLPSVMGVAQISGIVLYHAAKHEIPITMYSPNEVKSRVTGYGAADKAQVTAMVTRLLGLKAAPRPADAADALALAITHAWELGRGTVGFGRLPGAGAAAGVGAAVAPGGALTPAQQAWAAAEARVGKRRRDKRR